MTDQGPAHDETQELCVSGHSLGRIGTLAFLRRRNMSRRLDAGRFDFMVEELCLFHTAYGWHKAAYSIQPRGQIGGKYSKSRSPAVCRSPITACVVPVSFVVCLLLEQYLLFILALYSAQGVTYHHGFRYSCFCAHHVIAAVMPIRLPSCGQFCPRRKAWFLFCTPTLAAPSTAPVPSGDPYGASKVANN